MKLYVFPQRDILALRIEDGSLRLILHNDETAVTVEDAKVTTLSDGYILASFITKKELTQLGREEEEEEKKEGQRE